MAGLAQRRTRRGRPSPAGITRVLAIAAISTMATVWLANLGARLLRRAGRRGRLKESGWTSLSVAWDAWRATRGGPRAIASRQQTRLAELVSFARDCSPYYRTLYQQLPTHIADVQQLPVVTKRELMSHFDDWVTDPAVTRAGLEAFLADKSLLGQCYLGRYLVFTTSGTTGVPAILVHDRRSLVVMAGLSFARGLLRWITLRELWRTLRQGGRSAVLLATGGHFAGEVLAEYRRRESRRWARLIRVFSVLSTLPELVAGLNRFQPALLGGYATALALLAQEQEAGRLRIHPALVWSTAESLAPPMRQRVASAFDCALREGYAASEAAPIALECARGWLHVNADWFIVEPVDAHYEPVPPGRASHTVLVTNLANRVQPIIRYDLGDSVTVKPEPCPCGNPLPAVLVEGRSDEVLAFLTPEGQTVDLLPLALATTVEEIPGVRSFQLIQTAPMTLTVRLESAPAADSERIWEAVRQRLQTYLAAQGLSTVSIERAAEPPSRDPRTGKLRHVWVESKSGGKLHSRPSTSADPL